MKPRLLVSAVVLAVLQTGCFVQVKPVDDPSSAFADARREARRLNGRAGPPRELQILAFDEGDHKLVRLRLPIWLVEEIDDDDDFEFDVQWDDDGEKLRHYVRKHLRPSEIAHAELGIIVEIEERSGDRVLIWLS